MSFLERWVPYQGIWQIIRGMDKLNGHFGASRTLDEVIEWMNEPNPLKALEEQIDVLIVTFGGMYETATAAGVPFDMLDKMLEAKFAINCLKYPEDERARFGTDTQAYVDWCRSTWPTRNGTP